MSGVIGQRHMLNRQSRVRDRVWQSMRILRTFPLPDLVATAEAGHDNVKKYVRGLETAGIVRMVRRPTGHKGGHAHYHLMRDLGPHAPRLRIDGTTYDPNACKTMLGGIDQRGGA